MVARSNECVAHAGSCGMWISGESERLKGQALVAALVELVEI